MGGYIFLLKALFVLPLTFQQGWFVPFFPEDEDSLFSPPSPPSRVGGFQFPQPTASVLFFAPFV